MTDQGSGSSRAKNSEEDEELAKICNLKLPPFWVNSPSTWFIQAEAQFALCRISSDLKKYYYVLASLPQEVIESILDYVQSPPDVAVYQGIKQLLTERHSMSETNRIERLLSSEELGDRKPSDFYRYLKQLAGTSATFSDDLIKKLWLRRLPRVINVALIPHQDDDIKEIASLADKIWEASQTQLSQVASVMPFSDSVSELKLEIEELKKLVRNMSSGRNNDTRSRSRGRSPSASRRGDFESGSKMCWYHRKFGDRANKCVQPCSYTPDFNTSNKKN